MITKTQTQIFNGCRGFIDSTDWDVMSSEEQHIQSAELAREGLALVRVWNMGRQRDILTVVRADETDVPARLEAVSSPFEFGIDFEDDRIPGANDIKFVVENHDSRADAQKTLIKFLAAIRRLGIESTEEAESWTE